VAAARRGRTALSIGYEELMSAAAVAEGSEAAAGAPEAVLHVASRGADSAKAEAEVAFLAGVGKASERADTAPDPPAATTAEDDIGFITAGMVWERAAACWL